MSGRRHRAIRLAARLVIQGDKEAAVALEMLRATWKEVRRAGRLSMRKIYKAAGKIRSSVTLPKDIVDIYEPGMEPKTNG
jgi:hypothetical protein